MYRNDDIELNQNLEDTRKSHHHHGYYCDGMYCPMMYGCPMMCGQQMMSCDDPNDPDPRRPFFFHERPLFHERPFFFHERPFFFHERPFFHHRGDNVDY